MKKAFNNFIQDVKDLYTWFRLEVKQNKEILLRGTILDKK